MFIKSVAASTANARPGSMIFEMARVLNQFILYHVLGNPALRIKTNFDVENELAFAYANNGEIKAFAATTTFDTGTAKVIAADQWAAALLTIDEAGDPQLAWGDDAATEALAIANLPVVEQKHTPVGYVTVKTAVGETWIAGTSALQGGTGGNVSSDTNYYNGASYTVLGTRELGVPS